MKREKRELREGKEVSCLTLDNNAFGCIYSIQYIAEKRLQNFPVRLQRPRGPIHPVHYCLVY